MKRKILTPAIIVICLTFIMVSISACSSSASLVSNKEELEFRKSNSLFFAKETQTGNSINGIVKEISDHNLIITEFNEEREEKSSLVVPIAQDAKIVSEYMLYIFAKGTSNEEIEEYIKEHPVKDEVTAMVSGPKGGYCYLGEKEIAFEDIEIGDVLFIILAKSDNSIKGTYVKVWPVGLFD